MIKLSTSKGMSLFELIFVIGLIGIILGIGIPSMEEAISNAKMTTQVNDLVTDINQSRNEAISRGMNVVICRSNNSQTACGGDNQWENGWIVFADQNGDGVYSDATPLTKCTVDSFEILTEDCLLKKHQAFETNTLRFSGFNSNIKVVFDARGFSAGYNGTFTFCDKRGDAKAAYKVLQQSGRLKTANSGATCP